MAGKGRTPSLSIILVLLFSVSSRTDQLDAQAEKNDSVRDASARVYKDCEKRWSCEGYRADSIGIHHHTRNCACDELCPLFRDCCPDALRDLPPVSEQSSLPAPTVSGQSSLPAPTDPARKNFLDAGNAVVNNRERSEFDSLRRTQSAELRNKDGGGVPEMRALFSEDVVPEAKTTASPQLQNKELYERYNLNKDMFSCIDEKPISPYNNVSMVTRCPESYDDVEVTQLCGNVTDDDMMTRLPVSGLESKMLYRNMFCAMCHQEPYAYWTVKLACQKAPSDYNVSSTRLPDMLNNDSLSCKLEFESPSDTYSWRPCFSDVIDRCKDSFPLHTPYQQDVVRRCEDDRETVQRMVFAYTMAYRNQYCAECNSYPFPSLSCYPLYLGTRGRIFRKLYSFSILLDINTNSGSATVGHIYKHETVERNETVSCETGHVFDPFRSLCRPVSCGPGRYFAGNTCKKTTRTAMEISTAKDLIHNRSRDLISGKRNISFDIYPTLECSGSLIELNQTEYQLFQNGTLELLGRQAFYNSSHYFVEGERLHLCVDYSRNYTRTVTERVSNGTSAFLLPEAVVSTVGIVVSLVALALTMLVYFSLRALRNIPGQNLLSLVCALFLADLLLLLAPVAEEEFLACAVVAGAMHYFFLASFLWMNVMALDVWFTFSKAFVKAGDRGKSSKRFLMYSAYAWLTPVAFVSSAALVQILEPASLLTPGYGQGLCWLANKYALSVFFAAPLLLLLALNIAFFLVSARNISKAKQTTARMLGKEEKGRMGIYVKLTVVMGITWVLGFLAALVPDNEVLKYCFVIMNTLQGLFICLSFVFTRKVLTLLKDKFCGQQRKFKVTKSASTDMTNVSSKSPSANRKLSTASYKSHNAIV